MRSTTVTSTFARRSALAAASPPNPPPTIATRRRSGMDRLRLRGRPEPLDQVVADPQGVRHRGQCRVDGADAREAARVDDVEVVDLVRAAVRVQDRGRGVQAEATCPGLMRDARDRDLVLE